MIVHDIVINEWVIYSALDFVSQFKIKEEVMKEFNLKDISDLYEAKGFSSDSEFIEAYLEKDKRKFKIEFRWSQEHHDECWFIREVK